LPKAKPSCGTTSGYTFHYVKQEKPCESCKQAKAEYRKLRYKDNPHISKGWTIKNYYNITLEQYKKLFNEQNGVCAICHQPETKKHHTSGKIMSLSVDHDRSCCPEKKSCGECVRGLLCFACNVTIGRLEIFVKNQGSLENITNYIKAREKNGTNHRNG